MPKMMLFQDEARAALGRGVATLTRAVGSTLGPKGGNAIIDVPIGTPIISRDGVSIAAEIELRDPFENMGAQVVREVSKKTNEIAGDGTTTATVLANAIVQEGFEALDGTVAAIELSEGIDVAVEAIVARLRQMAQPVGDAAAVESVAVIAANDAETGKLVAEALQRVGPAGLVSVDLSLTVDTTLDVLEGASYERGYVSHHMVTDVETMQVLLDDIVILLTDQGLASEEDIASLRKLTAEAGKPMLVIAEDYAPEAVAALLRPSDGPQIVCVHAPEYGKWRRATMEDLAVMTGARVFMKDLGHRFQDAALDDLGEARGVRISSDTTVISGGRGDPEAIRGRIAQVKRQAELNEVLIEEDKFNERLAKLSGGIAVVHAGGATPVEQKRRAQLIEDALNATRAAIEEGVVPGGGVALLQCQSILDGVSGELSPGRRRGVEIVKVALSKPLTWIAENSGVDAKRVIDQVLAAPAGTGYDARTGAMVPMIDAGIADPVRVTTQALINAASVAKLVLTTHTLITDVPDDVDPTAEPARGGGAERLGMD